MSSEKHEEFDVYNVDKRQRKLLLSNDTNTTTNYTVQKSMNDYLRGRCIKEGNGQDSIKSLQHSSKIKRNMRDFFGRKTPQDQEVESSKVRAEDSDLVTYNQEKEAENSVHFLMPIQKVDKTRRKMLRDMLRKEFKQSDHDSNKIFNEDNKKSNGKLICQSKDKSKRK